MANLTLLLSTLLLCLLWKHWLISIYISEKLWDSILLVVIIQIRVDFKLWQVTLECFLFLLSNWRFKPISFNENLLDWIWCLCSSILLSWSFFLSFPFFNMILEILNTFHWVLFLCKQGRFCVGLFRAKWGWFVHFFWFTLDVLKVLSIAYILFYLFFHLNKRV